MAIICNLSYGRYLPYWLIKQYLGHQQISSTSVTCTSAQPGQLEVSALRRQPLVPRLTFGGVPASSEWRPGSTAPPSAYPKLQCLSRLLLCIPSHPPLLCLRSPAHPTSPRLSSVISPIPPPAPQQPCLPSTPTTATPRCRWASRSPQLPSPAAKP